MDSQRVSESIVELKREYNILRMVCFILSNDEVRSTVPDYVIEETENVVDNIEIIIEKIENAYI